MAGTVTTFRIATTNGTPAAAKLKVGAMSHPPPTGPPPAAINGGIPLSARKAQALDLATVERRGQGTPSNPPPKPNRMFGLQEAPTFRPTADEFKDPLQYIASIREEAQQYGIAKIIPPDSWNPPFAIDTERFHFRTRRQELNSVEGGTRANLNYLDQLAKFHKQHGNSLTRFPSVDKRPLDLYKLKKAVETRGGFERVCKQKKWAEIGRDLGYSGKIMSSLSTSLKNSYQKWLHPYEEYLRVVKPGVQQMLEHENGGPYTPSPAPSPMKKSSSAHGTPNGNSTDSPAMRASAALNASIHPEAAPTPPPAELPRPSVTSGFTAVNTGGFTAVNAQSPQPAPVASSAPTPNGLPNISASNGYAHSNGDSRTSTPLRNGSPMLSAHNTPDLRPSAVSLTPLSNGQAFSHLKRTLSQDTEGGMTDDGDAANGRRSKRIKKGKRIRRLQKTAFFFDRASPGRDPGWITARLLRYCLSYWRTTLANSTTCRCGANSGRISHDPTSPVNTEWWTNTATACSCSGRASWRCKCSFFFSYRMRRQILIQSIAMRDMWYRQRPLEHSPLRQLRRRLSWLLSRSSDQGHSGIRLALPQMLGRHRRIWFRGRRHLLPATISGTCAPLQASPLRDQAAIRPCHRCSEAC